MPENERICQTVGVRRKSEWSQAGIDVTKRKRPRGVNRAAFD
jgi:hypothetical protein